MKCKVEGCNNDIFAKGYCKKHYFRFIRNGDPEKARKRGRKKSEYRIAVTRIFSDLYSTRTIDKIIACLVTMHRMNLTQQEKLEMMRKAERSNKKMNVEKLERLVDSKLIALYMDLDK